MATVARPGSGGTSVYIGDGALSYAGEEYGGLQNRFRQEYGRDVRLSAAGNPAHSARGPINVFGLRLRVF
jgi:high affinity Mn2+ porin